jgi:circadian clock protein KaiB
VKYALRLYITGRTASSCLAIENLKILCEQRLKGEHELDIIDVLENPELAEQDKVMATPTLIRRYPTPIRKIIGDLSDKHKVLVGLDLNVDDTAIAKG